MPSTAVRDIVYDAGTGDLFVTFVTSGRRYVYRGVPAELAGALGRAFSKGQFFNAHIRESFPSERLAGPLPGSEAGGSTSVPTSPTLAQHYHKPVTRG